MTAKPPYALLTRLYKKIASKEAQASVNEELFSIVKEAGAGSLSLSSLASTAKNLAGSSFGRGMATAAGAAVPATLAGNYLINRGTEEARNKALQTAGGVAALGAGLYGLHRALGPAEKRASPDDDAVQKLAAAVYLDELLSTEALRTKLSEEVVEELVRTNKQYGGELIRSLIS